MATTSRDDVLVGLGPYLPPAPPPAAGADGHDDGYDDTLASYRRMVTAEMRRVIAGRRFRRALSSRLAEYPLRAGKGLRPALCLATAQALGARLEDGLPSAVALELFHNAFLVHDDVEDGSLHRRGDPTLHRKYGVGIAVNVGDALNVLTMTPLLRNLDVIGFDKGLRVFREIERMGRESVEGQAMELEWVRSGTWDLTERDYHVMTVKKTCWYTCIAPCRIGAIIGSGPAVDPHALTSFGRDLGMAFQIQDDVLNVVGEEARYGKETAGDILEGKRTLLLLHLFERAPARDVRRARAILAKPRDEKTEEDVAGIVALLHAHGCVDHARDVSLRYARKARATLRRCLRRVPESVHTRFLERTVDFVVERDL